MPTNPPRRPHRPPARPLRMPSALGAAAFPARFPALPDASMVMVVRVRMPVAVIAVLMVVVIMVMAVIGFDLLRLGIAVHRRLDHLPERILLQGDVGRQKSRQPGEDDRLRRQDLVAAAFLRGLGVAETAGQSVSEQLVEIALELTRGSSIGGRAVLAPNRSRVAAEARVEHVFEAVLLVQVTTHSLLLKVNSGLC